jgi:hypothetical protein
MEPYGPRASATAVDAIDARSTRTVILLFIFPQRTFSKEAIHASAQVKPVSEFLQTHGPGKLRHRSNPLLPSLSQTLPTFLYATPRQKTAATLHSQKISGHQHTMPIDRGFCATDVDRLVNQRQEFVISRHVATVMRVMKRGE